MFENHLDKLEHLLYFYVEQKFYRSVQIKVRFFGLFIRYSKAIKRQEGSWMQTLYYTTNNFVRHTGNLVNLSEYRRKLEAARQERLSWMEQDEEPEQVQPRPRRSQRRQERRAALLDMWASMGILVMTVTFTLHVLCL